MDVLKSSLNGLLEIPGVLGVKVINHKDKQLIIGAGFIIDNNDNTLYINPYSGMQRRVEITGYFTKLFWHKFDVFYQKLDNTRELIGHTTIYSSTEVVMERIKYSVLVTVFSEIIEIVAMWIIFLLVSRRILGRPLAILTSATELLTNDDIVDYKVDINSKGRHELKLLEEAFNAAAAKLRTARDELENRMRLALNAGRIATWIWYPDGDRLEFDNNLPSIFGQPANNFGSSFREIKQFFHTADLNLFTATVESAIVTRHPFTIDVRVIARDYSEFYVAIQAITQGGESEERPLRLVGTAMDITERKLMNIELEAARVTADHAREVAEQASKSKGDFLATMSHEIRTPMNAIQGSVELLRRKQMSAEHLKLVEMVSNATKNLLHILDDILDLSKVEDGKLQLAFVDFDLPHFLRQLLAVMSPNAEKKGLKLTLELVGDVPHMVLGDPIRVQQIFSNLLSNAIKFTNHGEIKLQVRKIESNSEHTNLEFLVIDSGIGIATDKIQKIFDHFTQIDSSRSRAQQGTGLGLSICKQLVNLMDGSIEVESRQGTGSIFRVILPFDEVIATIQRQEIQAAQSLLPLSLLLVEDEPISQMIVQALLADEGYDVVTASSGKEALAEIAQNYFDVILMDLRMPQMDGFETSQLIRSLPGERVAKTPIIAFTGDVMKETVNICLESGMDGVIAKPIDIIEFNRILSAVVQKKKQPQ